jgi:imidazolonepropionase-like amidohydrolase
MFAIRAGFAFDGSRALPGGALVLCDQGRIVGVESGDAVPPDDCPVIAAPAATLLPGLIDAHVHLCGDGTDGTLERLHDVPADALSDVIETSLRRQRAAGVTAVRDLGDRRYAVIDWNARRRPGDALPAIVASGPPITSVRGHCANMGGEVAGEEQVRSAVRERAERGVDVIKVMGSGGFHTAGTDVLRCQFSSGELRAAVDEAHRVSLPVTVHAHPRAAVLQAIECGVDGIEHCSFLTERGIAPQDEDLLRLAAAGIAACLTVGFTGRPHPPANAQTLLEQSGIAFSQVLATLRAHPPRMFAAGVRMIAGADAGIGAAKPHGILPVTLQWYVDGGIPIADALRLATAAAADGCGLGDRKGRLRVGYDADLLLVGGDATADIAALSRPLGVWIGGRRATGTSEFDAACDRQFDAALDRQSAHAQNGQSADLGGDPLRN